MYLKTQIQRIVFCGKLKNWDWTLRRETPEISQDAPGKNWIREGKRQPGGIIQKGEPHEWDPCAPRSEEQPPEGTSWEADCPSNVAWNLGRKYASLSRTWNYVFFSCSGARDIEARMLKVYWGASMHNAEQGELSSDTMDTLRRSKTP